MKISSLIGIATFLVIAIFSCEDFESYDDAGYGYDEEYYDDYNSNDMDSYENDFNGNNQGQSRFTSNDNVQGGGIKMHPMRDSKTGAIIGQVPLPADWDISGPAWKGPGNTMVQSQQGGYFLDNQRMLTSIDQVIQQDIIPAMRSQGGNPGAINNHPEIAAFNQRLDATNYKIGQMQNSFAVKSIEFTNQQGMKGMIIVHFQRSLTPNGNMSGYNCQIMVANPNQFEASKKALVYALANIQMNGQYIESQNNAERQKLAANNAKFQNNLRAREQAFYNSQAQYSQYANDALDSGMASYQRRSAMTDAGQSNYVNGIHGTRDVTNPYDGTTWTVDDGYNNTYMNTWGETIQTDDAFYNPNMDPSVNNQDWQNVYEDY
ncbi:MAG: hypothetical protein KDC24_08530 [Saprospiraceae bacterium]|nr:hypothetical protein [Saprospiraceae bacterium]